MAASYSPPLLWGYCGAASLASLPASALLRKVVVDDATRRSSVTCGAQQHSGERLGGQLRRQSLWHSSSNPTPSLGMHTSCAAGRCPLNPSPSTHPHTPRPATLALRTHLVRRHHSTMLGRQRHHQLAQLAAARHGRLLHSCRQRRQQHLQLLL